MKFSVIRNRSYFYGLMKQQGIYIALGSNLGDKLNNLKSAIEKIELNIGKVVKKSSIYLNPPVGFESDDEFVNMVVQVESSLSAFDILVRLKEIEIAMGRLRKSCSTYESRIIDLDLIDFKGEIKNESDLELPHPRMHLRNFVLLPLSEIFADWYHPVLKLSIIELINDLPKVNEIRILMPTNV